MPDHAMRNCEAVSAKPVDVRPVTVATVIEARAPYTDEVDYLFSSLAIFGGALAGDAAAPTSSSASSRAPSAACLSLASTFA